jgi:hypothetical protein
MKVLIRIDVEAGGVVLVVRVRAATLKRVAGRDEIGVTIGDRSEVDLFLKRVEDIHSGSSSVLLV